MNLETAILKGVLSLESTERAEAYSRLHSKYFSLQYQSLIKEISKLYSEYGNVLSLPEIESKLRSEELVISIESIKNTEELDVDIDILIDGLVDRYAQDSALQKIESFVDKVQLLSSEEIIDQLAVIPRELEDDIDCDGAVYHEKDLMIFRPKEESEEARINTWTMNVWDTFYGGWFIPDFILLGGYRGSGKSLNCINLCVNQARNGFPSAYFTIEMTALETLQRGIAIRSGVEYSKIKLNKMDYMEQMLVAKAMAESYIGGAELYHNTYESDYNTCPFEFQKVLLKMPQKENSIIIIDDRNLKLSSIDLQLQKLKAKYGKKLRLVVVDYINRVKLDGSTDDFDWKDQVKLSNSFKDNIARKHEVCLLSPYQVDPEGKARFAQGLLDACDTAIILQGDKTNGTMGWRVDKMRGADDTQEFVCHMDWKTLTIRGNPYTPSAEGDLPDDDTDDNIALSAKRRMDNL